jgi:hypothetical protein
LNLGDHYLKTILLLMGVIKVDKLCYFYGSNCYVGLKQFSFYFNGSYL